MSRKWPLGAGNALPGVEQAAARQIRHKVMAGETDIFRRNWSEMCSICQFRYGGLLLLVVLASGGLISATLLERRGAGQSHAPIEPIEVERARHLYTSTCAACHGMQGQGMPRRGASLRASQFVRTGDSAAIAELLARGRAVDDRANFTGVAMPPRGGNPNLSDADLRLLAAYLKAQCARVEDAQCK